MGQPDACSAVLYSDLTSPSAIRTSTTRRTFTMWDSDQSATGSPAAARPASISERTDCPETEENSEAIKSKLFYRWNTFFIQFKEKQNTVKNDA